MPYGTIKVDNITFDNGGTDKLITVSGLFFSTSGALTVTGTISGGNVTAPTATFTTLTGTTTAGTTATFTSGSFTSLTGVTTTVTSGVFGLGSAAAPSIAFSGDTNNGIYSPGADQVAISTNGTGRLFVDASGNVGIGVVPSAQYSTVKVLQVGALGATIIAGNTSAGGTSAFGQNYYTDPTTAAPKYAASSYPATAYHQYNGEHRWFNAPSGTAGNTITFTQAMTLDASGRLGIGTISPSDRLTIYGGGQANTGIVATFGNYTGTVAASKIHFTDNYIYDWSIGGNASQHFVFNSAEAGATAGTTRMIIQNDGKVGIGTTSPTYKLHASGTTGIIKGDSAGCTFGNPSLSLTDSTHGVELLLTPISGLGAIGTYTNHPLVFYTNNGERARIDSSGRVGIGTTTPLATLESGGGVNKASIRIADGAHDGSSSTFRYPALTYYARQDNTRRAIDPLTQGTGSNGGASAAIVFTDEPGNYSFPNNVRSSSIEFYTADNNLGGNVAYEPLNRLSISSTGTSTFTSNASTAPAIFKIDASEVSRIDSSGRLLVGTSSARTDIGSNQTAAIQTESTVNGLGYFSAFNQASSYGSIIALAKSRGASVGSNTIVQSGDQIGGVYFYGADGVDTALAAGIDCYVDGTPGSNDMPGRLVFSTTADGAASPTERLRITSGGVVVVGNTSAFSITSSTATGSQLGNDGYFLAYTSSQTAAYFGRQTSDGTIVEFRQDGTQEGSISVSGTTVSYNGAHLSRWSQLPNGATREEILRGTVLSNIDEMCGWGEEDNEQLNRMKVSDVEGDKNVSGVFQAWDDDDDTYTDDFYCAMTGDFIIRIAEGVTVQRGDLLMSAGDGTAKPQDDDIIRSKTVAKVTSTHVTCTYEDGSYCVPCVLMAC